MSYIVSAVRSEIARHLAPGQLVDSRVDDLSRHDREVVQPMLEAAGLKVGRRFLPAFSPERVDPGQPALQDAEHPEGRRRRDARPAPSSRRRSTRRRVETVVPVSSTRVAEMVKLLENTFRAVNIGLVNEIALMCDKMDIDVWEVIDAATTKPFGFMPFYPGPGLGGHCIPIDPFYLSWKAKQTGFEARFIELAGHVNGQMPHFVVEKVQNALNDSRQGREGIARAHLRRRLQARRRRHARVAGARHHPPAAAPRRAGDVHRSVSCRRCGLGAMGS